MPRAGMSIAGHLFCTTVHMQEVHSTFEKEDRAGISFSVGDERASYARQM